MQIKIKQRFQDSKYYEKVKKIKRKIHRMFKKKDKHKKSKLILTISKKTWLRILIDFIEKQKSKLTKKNWKITSSSFEKTDKKIITRNLFVILFSQQLKKLKRKQFNYIKFCKNDKRISNPNTHEKYKIS